MTTPINLPERPLHQRKQSSKSILLKALVSPVKLRGQPSNSSTLVTKKILRPDWQSHVKDRSHEGIILEERSLNRLSSSRARSCHDEAELPSPEYGQHSHEKSTNPSKTSVARPLREINKENATPRSSTETHSSVDHLRSSHEDTTRTPRPREHGSPRKISDSSTETPSTHRTLNIVKRGARVMAAVAALQSKSVPPLTTQGPEQLDATDVEARFEAMLSNRNVPVAMRDKMRSLTLRMKADLVKQEQDVSALKTAEDTGRDEGYDAAYDEGKSTKRSRPRSRTFTFSKGDRATDGSPSKKHRGRSRSRPAPIHINDDGTAIAAAPSTPRRSSARGSRTENPGDYIAYLQKEQDPTKVEIGRLHKLRILLRNETVAWVDNFVAMDGMAQINGLLHRLMAIEWREDHEDQLLHETLLCLKGLCTTETALNELQRSADELFPALLAMLFDDEKKGPAEYATRAIIINVLFAYLSAKTPAKPIDLERRARTVLAYLSGVSSSDGKQQPHEFLMDMQIPRPYKLWCREMTNVTREVFWIFLHHLNVIPAARPASSASDDHDERSGYVSRHFPGIRPPIPAAPYIGGVEWDAATYITSHLDLLNGLIAALPDSDMRNALRQDFQASGFEKTMGGTLRTCKEKFYSGVHDGLRAWAAAAIEDDWPVLYVCEGPTLEEQAKSARASPKKGGKSQPPPKIEEIKLDMPKLDLDLGITNDDHVNDGWLEP